MRILFAGTPEVAVPALAALHASDFEVVGVLTRADAPAGRGRKLMPSLVKEFAVEHELPVFTPATLRDESAQALLEDLRPDLVAVVAYGLLVPPELLDLPKLGWVNLHFSLLPKYRGAAPVQQAIIARDLETGMSVFKIAPGLDDGDILAQLQCPLKEYETSGQALMRLAEVGAGFFCETLQKYAAGQITLRPQEDTEATHAPKLSPAQAQIDFNQSQAQVIGKILGYAPAPGAWTNLQGKRIKVLELDPVAPGETPGQHLAPGEVLALKKTVWVGTADEPIKWGMIAPAGKKTMRASDWARGAQLPAGVKCEEQ